MVDDIEITDFLFSIGYVYRFVNLITMTNTPVEEIYTGRPYM
jgi:hypothetical protein